MFAGTEKLWIDRYETKSFFFSSERRLLRRFCCCYCYMLIFLRCSRLVILSFHHFVFIYCT